MTHLSWFAGDKFTQLQWQTHSLLFVVAVVLLTYLLSGAVSVQLVQRPQHFRCYYVLAQPLYCTISGFDNIL